MDFILHLQMFHFNSNKHLQGKFCFGMIFQTYTYEEIKGEHYI